MVFVELAHKILGLPPTQVDAFAKRDISGTTKKGNVILFFALLIPLLFGKMELINANVIKAIFYGKTNVFQIVEKIKFSTKGNVYALRTMLESKGFADNAQLDHGLQKMERNVNVKKTFIGIPLLTAVMN